VQVFSATITRNYKDPTKPPKEIGQISKNPVDPYSSKKLLSAVDEINSDILLGKVKKRILKKLY